MKQIVAHPNYKPLKLGYDIAIIRLSSEAALSDYVQPVCLWDSGLDFPLKLGIAVGFANKEIGKHLRKVFIPIIPTEMCASLNETFSEVLKSDNVFCGGYLNGEQKYV